MGSGGEGASYDPTRTTSKVFLEATLSPISLPFFERRAALRHPKRRTPEGKIKSWTCSSVFPSIRPWRPPFTPLLPPYLFSASFETTNPRGGLALCPFKPLIVKSYIFIDNTRITRPFPPPQHNTISLCGPRRSTLVGWARGGGNKKISFLSLGYSKRKRR